MLNRPIHLDESESRLHEKIDLLMLETMAKIEADLVAIKAAAKRAD